MGSSLRNLAKFLFRASISTSIVLKVRFFVANQNAANNLKTKHDKAVNVTF